MPPRRSVPFMIMREKWGVGRDAKCAFTPSRRYITYNYITAAAQALGSPRSYNCVLCKVGCKQRRAGKPWAPSVDFRAPSLTVQLCHFVRFSTICPFGALLRCQPFRHVEKSIPHSYMTVNSRNAPHSQLCRKPIVSR